MVTRRDLLRVLVAAGVTAPALSACGSQSGGGEVTKLTLARSDLVRAAGDPQAAAAVAGRLGSFAARLYPELPGTGNLVFSPYSIAVALGMTLNGAAGTTAAEMRHVLGVDDIGVFNEGMNSLTQRLEGLAGEKLTLATANSLWGQADTAWRGPFLDVLARDYGTGMRQVDFKTASEAVRSAINAWTADQTHDKIPEIVPQGVLDAMTRLVLVNAIYVKAAWQHPFEKGATGVAPFHLSDGSTVAAPMMRMADGSFARGEGSGFQSIRLPYDGSALAMTVVLPDPGATANGGMLEEALTAPARDSVGVELPRWTFRLQTRLVDVLSTLGMPTAFSDRADFSGMTEQEPLQIADVLHEAFIAVDENGTEAAAATAVVMRTTSLRLNPVVVTVDRPFLFVIHDVQDKTPLFVGRVDNPLTS
jgi:serine protease inhibitor